MSSGSSIPLTKNAIISEERKANNSSINVPNTIKEENSQNKEEFTEDQDLSCLSFSSYDSLENIKLEKMGQYTCDQCSEIPKIISTNIEKQSLLIKCKNHGQKEISLKDYIINCLKYNPNNWKCTDSEHVQNSSKEIFKYCQCGLVFCENCYNLHQIKNEKNAQQHSKFIDSDKYFLQCKNLNHFGQKYSGYCYECDENFCEQCQNTHKNHSKVKNSSMEIDKGQIDKIRNLNREYRSLINYYESLIRLNNLIIYSYEKNRGNYYNLYNINRIIANIKRKNIISSLKDDDNKNYENFNQGIVPGENNSNFNHYIKDLYSQELKEEETIEVKIDNKFFNNFDLKILTQIPLNNLKILELDNNGISTIDYLENAEFPELIVLSLKNNAIEDISVLERVKFEEIQGLLLSNNNIKDISVFKKTKFKNLRLIDLRNNKINNIDVFEALSALQCIYLSGNNFDINKFEGAKKLLEKCVEFTF